jgi:hypothetical protein
LLALLGKSSIVCFLPAIDGKDGVIGRRCCGYLKN